MATQTNALVSLEEIVSTFLFAYKKNTEDYSLYTQHCARCIQDFNLYDGNIAQSVKVQINTTLKCIDMPDDMLTFIDLLTPQNGAWWSFSQKDQIVNTTTTTLGVEGRDSAQGEGVKINQNRVIGYGAKGGVNKFNMTLDWSARRIYVDDVYSTTDYFVLLYVSSGINTTTETKIPAFVVPMIEAYLLEKETYWTPALVRERPMRFDVYWKEKMKVRNLINSMSYDGWRDVFLNNVTQTIQR
jgi:hypothetical protein